MEILEAFDLTGSFRAAGELAGCSHHTVEHYVALRDEGRLAAAGEPQQRAKLIDPHLAKIEEWVERSNGKIRADVVARQARGGRVRRVGAHGAPGGGRGEGELSGRAAAGVSAVDPGAGDVGAVGLGSGPDGRRPGDEPVLRLAGVVPVPGGDRRRGTGRCRR